MNCCMGVAVITIAVLCAGSQDSLLSLSMLRYTSSLRHIFDFNSLRLALIFSTTGFKCGGKPYPHTSETAGLQFSRRSVTQSLRLKFSFSSMSVPGCFVGKATSGDQRIEKRACTTGSRSQHPLSSLVIASLVSTRIALFRQFHRPKFLADL